MKYDVMVSTTDLEDTALSLAVKQSGYPDVQALLDNRLREVVVGAVGTYLGTVADKVREAVSGDVAKLAAVAVAAQVDLSLLTADTAIVAEEIK